MTFRTTLKGRLARPVPYRVVCYFDLRLAGGQFVLRLDLGTHKLEQIVFVRQHAIFDVQGEAPRKTAQRVENAIGIGWHVSINADKVFFVAEARARQLQASS